MTNNPYADNPVVLWPPDYDLIECMRDTPSTGLHFDDMGLCSCENNYHGTMLINIEQTGPAPIDVKIEVNVDAFTEDDGKFTKEGYRYVQHKDVVAIGYELRKWEDVAKAIPDLARAVYFMQAVEVMLRDKGWVEMEAVDDNEFLYLRRKRLNQ